MVRALLPRVVGVLVSLCAAVPALVQGQVSLVYRQSTGSQEDRVEITDEPLPTGALLGITISSGETYRIETDASGGVVACSFEFPPEGTSWKAEREGSTLRLTGTVQRRKVSRTFRIDTNPWYESVERSLQSYALSAAREAVRFWMVEPYGGTPYLMAGKIERLEPVGVNGRRVDAIRVVVRPDGILSFLWNSVYWFDPADGTFLRSQSVRGLFKVVPTVLELMEDRRAGR
jgi:hypothetical protein